MNETSALNLGVEGYFISPDAAKVLESSLLKSPQDEEIRSKLLGFYYAHSLCCPETIERRVAHIEWAIDNHQEVGHMPRSFLALFSPEDQPHITRVRSAWQRRIDAQPNDTASLEHMGWFLLPVRPHDACGYYERAQHTSEVPLDGPAIDICRNALRHWNKLLPAKSPESVQLRNPPMKDLWNDLINTDSRRSSGLQH
jgi:hypothetical protein